MRRRQTLDTWQCMYVTISGKMCTNKCNFAFQVELLNPWMQRPQTLFQGSGARLVCSTSLMASLIRSVGGLSKCFYQGLWVANLTADVIGRSINRPGVAYSLFHPLLTPRIGLYTVSVVSLKDALIGWRASNCDTPIQLLRIQINTGNTVPSPMWCPSPTWRKQKAYYLFRGLLHCGYFAKAGNSLAFQRARTVLCSLTYGRWNSLGCLGIPSSRDCFFFLSYTISVCISISVAYRCRKSISIIERFVSIISIYIEFLATII